MGWQTLWMLIVLAMTMMAEGYGAPRVRRQACTSMALSKLSLQFDYHNVPYAAGIHLIHSPEHISAMHGVGPPLFHIDCVEPPKISEGHSSIAFRCSTFLIPNMQVRMFTSQPDICNMLFFKDRRALYRVKLTVIPTKVHPLHPHRCPGLRSLLPQAFLSYRLCLDVTLFSTYKSFRASMKSLLPIFIFVESLQDAPLHVEEDEHFKAYRRSVLRGGGSSNDFWIMAERVLREYTC